MPKLYLSSGIKAFDDLGAQTSVLYVIYALAFIAVFLWIIISFSKSKGLVNHRNAVALRGLVNFLRTADPESKQTDELFATITKNQNDVAMLFYMYCRIHSNFGFIEHYLNYRAYKHVNRKKKPWGFTPVVVLAILITLVFSISYFVGIQYLLDMNMPVSKLLVSIAFPLALFLVWLMFRIIILMKYKMYWVEFENKFRKVNVMCKNFFKSQEDYYEEFADNVLSKLVPYGGTKRRIEQIIAMTDPDDVSLQSPYVATRTKSKKKNIEDIDKQMPAATNSQENPNQLQGMVPRGAQILRPHSDAEAFLQAQAQITNQLMQMMMQQSMQQSQVVQRALTSQQALANTVAQQNIMAMRLEAQQTSLLRPDLAKRLAEQTYGWQGNRHQMEHDMYEEAEPAPKPSPDTVEIKKEPKETIVETAVKEVKEVKVEPVKDKGGLNINKLTEAFVMLSPPQSMNAEPDPIFIPPEREQTNVEKRLEQFFAPAKVYVYDDITEGEMI